ncbi:hypothetical protein J7J83_03740 [bacterium]|nr:hypothetical protein [bacterium]
MSEKKPPEDGNLREDEGSPESNGKHTMIPTTEVLFDIGRQAYMADVARKANKVLAIDGKQEQEKSDDEQEKSDDEQEKSDDEQEKSDDEQEKSDEEQEKGKRIFSLKELMELKKLREDNKLKS